MQNKISLGKINNILFIGGSGYIGNACCNYFFKKKYKVGSIDNLIYGQKNFLDPKVLFKKKNIKNLKELKKFILSFNNIVILSGLVGDPITKKYPKIAQNTNNKYIIKLLNLLKNEKKKIVFVSTCSNYGILKNGISADEKFKLKPLSLYAKDKVFIEKFLIKNKKKFKFDFTILRFATAFGLSKRMRFDLTVNQFVKELFYGEKLNVYDLNTWRPYCHVIDFARLIDRVISADANIVKSQIFNAGADKNNHTKREILNKILKILKNKKNNLVFNENTRDKSDLRNYKVNFNKLRVKLNFIPKYDVNYGIKEILKKLKKGKFKDNPKQYGNYFISKQFH